MAAAGADSSRRHPVPGQRTSALEVSPAERTATFEAAWEQGGFMFSLATFSDLLLNEEANQTAASSSRSKIDEIVNDPAVAEMLKPRDVPVRHQAPAAGHELLRDVQPAQRHAGRPAAHPDRGDHRDRHQDHRRLRYDLDVIVYATGFDALTGPLLALGIRGRDGKALADAWAEGPKTYSGLAVPDFPNLFTITGPGSPSVLSNMPVSIEQHVEWIGDCLPSCAGTTDRHDRGRPRSATESWTDHVQQVAGHTLYPRPRPGTWGPTFPASRGCSCPTSAGSGSTGRSAAKVAAARATRVSRDVGATWPRPVDGRMTLDEATARFLGEWNCAGSASRAGR